MTSPVSGWRCGSIVTPWQEPRNCNVPHLIKHKYSVMVDYVETSRTRERQHPQRQTYARQTHVQQLVAK